MKIVNIFGLSIVLAVAWTASANNLFDGFGLVQTAAELIDPADHPALVEELLDTILGNPAFSPLRNLTELLKNVAVGDVPALVLDVVDVACKSPTWANILSLHEATRTISIRRRMGVSAKWPRKYHTTLESLLIS